MVRLHMESAHVLRQKWQSHGLIADSIKYINRSDCGWSLRNGNRALGAARWEKPWRKDPPSWFLGLECFESQLMSEDLA